MAETTQQNILTTELEQLIRKATDANMQILTETGNLIRQVLSRKIEIKDVYEFNNQVFSNALSDLVRINIHHTTNLIDWGVKISKDFAAQFAAAANPDSNMETAEVEEAVTVAPALELRLQGKQGGIAQTSFVLHSDKEEDVKGNFIIDPLVNKENQTLSTSAQFTPQEFEINNKEAVKITVAVNIPADAKTGMYNSRVQVTGFDSSEFYLVLEVTESMPAEHTEHPVKIPFKKKVVPKKSPKKK